MSPPRIRPPLGADERTQLVGWLDLQRAIAAWKCEGLSDLDAHRSVLPTSPFMTMAGIISHLRWTENFWFEIIFLGHPAGGPQFESPEDADMMVAGIPLAQLLEGAEPAEVAIAVGFYDQAHFTRHFKKHTATTPARYARSHACQ